MSNSNGLKSLWSNTDQWQQIEESTDQVLAGANGTTISHSTMRELARECTCDIAHEAEGFMWALFYFPVGFKKNANVTGQGPERRTFMRLRFWAFLMWVSTFAHFCISFASSADDGGNITNRFSFFCGVLPSPH
ncbi:predicted protein [Uncinocarpus reesii 1704]|uniref:Uncharacterized protein n=1 Tax=Uncinocarpus reesii (strain UAMH 1704) TaxID=336963 RepID=C4JKB6_UNCRE|nr:uncharacterized protein UREG_02073 [Uncinocarpus reesii 1704]EEP77224.1 predicted protein [Uncinocarpus reesii 1704]